MLKNFFETNDADPEVVWREFPEAQVIKRANNNDGYYVYGSLDIFFVACVEIGLNHQFEVAKATYPNAVVFDWDEKQNGFWCWNSEEDYNNVMKS